MPRTTVRDALVPAERLRQAIEKYRFQRAEEDFIFVTASFGLAELDLDAEDIMDTLIVRADEAMYRAKESGRNRVVLWDDVQQEAALP